MKDGAFDREVSERISELITNISEDDAALAAAAVGDSDEARWERQKNPKAERAKERVHEIRQLCGEFRELPSPDQLQKQQARHQQAAEHAERQIAKLREQQAQARASAEQVRRQLDRREQIRNRVQTLSLAHPWLARATAEHRQSADLY